MHATIGVGGLTIHGVRGYSCMVEFSVSRAVLRSMSVSGVAHLRVTALWTRSGGGLAWFGGISCGAIPSAGQSIASGEPLAGAVVTAEAMLRLSR